MRKELLDGEQAFVIHDFLTPEECAEYIRVTEEAGYGAAPITTPRGFMMAPEIRNNERVMLDNFAWAAKLWERAKPLVPSPYHGRESTGLNERFRFYRYDEGHTFRPHIDGHFARNDERSQLAFMVYLNAACEGSGDGDLHSGRRPHTLPDGAEIRVKPETGKALVFYHYLLHEGTFPVRSGLLSILRTDVMYASAATSELHCVFHFERLNGAAAVAERDTRTRRIGENLGECAFTEGFFHRRHRGIHPLVQRAEVRAVVGQIQRARRVPLDRFHRVDDIEDRHLGRSLRERNATTDAALRVHNPLLRQIYGIFNPSERESRWQSGPSFVPQALRARDESPPARHIPLSVRTLLSPGTAEFLHTNH